MSVIVGRALPEVRDGLKPVHRRILWSMLEAGLRPDRPHRKSAQRRRRGREEVPPARRRSRSTTRWSAWRRTSLCGTRWSTPTGTSGRSTATRRRRCGTRRPAWRPIAMELLRDIDAETVDFVPELRRLRAAAGRPARRASRTCWSTAPAGSRSGMATNIPPHNLGEVIDAVVHHLEHPEATSKDLMKFVKGPDFPTGGRHHGSRRHPRRVRDRARLDQDPRGRARSRRARPAAPASSSRSCRTR